LPSVHEVPFCTAGYVHVPELLHTSDVQALPSLHAAHAPPPVPQAAALVPVAHEVPLTQPVQQLPARHFPETPLTVHAVVSCLLVAVHVPPVQL
jgi:hypothetical protein